MPLLRLVDVTKRFGEITALDRVSLSIEDEEYVCVLGPTGAGKTTLLRTIAGLLEPDEGEIYVEDQLVNEVAPEERNTVYMFQQFALFPHMNVWQNVSFGPIIKGWDEESVEKISNEILDMVRLSDRWDAYPNELSGGMQQRVALARGIASGARILLLDEPLGALDARLRVDLRYQLRRLVKDQGLTAIHVTHDQEEALTVSDRVVVLREGRIEQTGTPEELYARPRSIFVMNFVGGGNFIEGTVVDFDDAGSTVEIRGGLRIRVSDRIHDVGERVVVAVRRENTFVRTERGSEINSLPGRVRSVSFVGSFIEYVVTLENGINLTSRVPIATGFRDIDGDETVIVFFSPEDTFVFSRPETGLLKEIEAI
ncbi:MAG: ABC transporter ATP-binding protein [Candidatus Bathyarchaeia archaeon]